MAHELAQTNDQPTVWVFRVRGPGVSLVEYIRSPDSPLIMLAQYVTVHKETAVHERLAFDARKRAAQILGVDPLELEQVK